jgi:hypothetical protein
MLKAISNAWWWFKYPTTSKHWQAWDEETNRLKAIYEKKTGLSYWSGKPLIDRTKPLTLRDSPSGESDIL